MKIKTIIFVGCSGNDNNNIDQQLQWNKKNNKIYHNYYKQKASENLFSQTNYNIW